MSVNEQAKERGALSLSLHQSHTSVFKWRIFYEAELTLRFVIGSSPKRLTVKERRGIFHALSSPNLAPGFSTKPGAFLWFLSRTAARGRAQNFLSRLPLASALLSRVRLRILPAEGIGDEERKSEVIFQ